MSYILEALKRIEHKRQREGSSRLLMTTGAAAEERKRWPVWPLSILAALLLLNAGVMIWWVHPWSPEKQPGPAQPSAVHEEVPVAPAKAPPGAKGEGRPGDMKEVRELKGTASSPAPGAGKETSDTSRAGRAPGAKRAYADPQVRPESRAAADGRVIALKELPPAIRSGLPELRISAHYYTADPQSRFTKINEQTVREGETFGPGVKLEEITPDGVVLSHEGYRFQMGINEGR